MKNLVLAIAMLFVTLSCAQTAPKLSSIAEAHKAAHTITMPTIAWGGGKCSATAIGPHALLTATHCMNQPSAVIKVDDKATRIDGLISDSLDHTIVLVDEEFKSFAPFAEKSRLAQGDDVFMFGNPGELSDIFRKGYVAGYIKPEVIETPLQAIMTPPAIADNEAIRSTFYDFNGFFGDSGSGIFNPEGQIVAVTSFINEQSDNGATIKFMGGFEIRFTKEQIKQAQDFKPVIVATPAPEKKHKTLLEWFSTEE